MVDDMTVEQRSATMSRIRSKNTQIELALRKALFRSGYRYRVHADWLPGKPDIVFTRCRIALFVDGDFWHGWRFETWSKKLAPYWREKITGNRERDRRHQKALEAEGWTVLRIWEHEIEEDLPACVKRVERLLRGHQK